MQMDGICESEVRSINNLANAEASNNVIKYFQEEHERAGEHEKVYHTSMFSEHEYTLS